MMVRRTAPFLFLALVIGCVDDPPDVGGDPDAGGELENACGGHGPLAFMGRAASPADRCGVCGTGALVCRGPDTLVCLGSLDASCSDGEATNACGGEKPLQLDGRPVTPGERCGPCRDGTVVCIAAEVVACIAATASDATACSGDSGIVDAGRDGDTSTADGSSVVDTGRDTIDADGGDFDASRDGSSRDSASSDAIVTSDVGQPNPCGGMGPLLWRGSPTRPGAACGPCGGRLRCASPTTLVCGGTPSTTNCPDAGATDICSIPPSAYTAPAPTLPTPPSEPVPPTTTATTITLAANSLVYNPFDFHLYVSVGSQQGADGNSVAVIDPYAGTILKSIFVGSEPTKLALSDDGTSLWVALDGAGALRRVDLVAGTAAQQFSVGKDSIGGVWYPRDVAVLPGTRDSVVVTRYSKSSSGDDGLIVYDNGVPRAYSTEYETSSAQGAIVTYSPQLVFGYQPGSTACVNANGIFKTKAPAPAGITQGRFSFAQNVVYTGMGVAYDIASATVLGTYAGRGSVAADPPRHRVYFLSETQAATVSAYDMDRFSPVGTETLSVGAASVGDNFVLWGRYGYAFRAGGQVVIARSALIAASP